MNSEALRELLCVAFSDEELSTFCYDHFREVKQNFTTGQSQTFRVQMLLEYCERKGDLDKLLHLVRKRNPSKYAEFASKHAEFASFDLPQDPPGAGLSRLAISTKEGIYGGFLGGTITGVIISIGCYHFSIKNGVDPGGWRILLIILFSSLMGTLLGASLQFTMSKFRTRRVMSQGSALFFNEISGGILGGATVGIPTGMSVGWFFWQLEGFVVDPQLLVCGSVLGTTCIGLVLLYEREKPLRYNTFFALLISAGIALLAFTFGAMVLNLLGFEKYFAGGVLPRIGPTYRAIVGGVLIGSSLGSILGLQVGIALYLCRLWAPRN
jgi:hypothetical protein